MSDAEPEVERTWDGLPISPEPPFGAMIVVYRRAGAALEFLLLHRGHQGPDYAGDWAWGPPAGARWPDEAIDACAARELLEETGLCLDLRCGAAGAANWFVYLAEASAEAEALLSAEHDRHAWLSLDQAVTHVAPEIVRAQLIAAARLLAESA